MTAAVDQLLAAAVTMSQKMKASDRYAKIVEWSDEDHCYVEGAPGLYYGGCHGGNELVVFEELRKIVVKSVEFYRREGRSLPPATSGRDHANKMGHLV